MNDFIYGMKKGIPIALGYFAVSFSFGVMAVIGITPIMATIISATNLTSSGQYAGVKPNHVGISEQSLGLLLECKEVRFRALADIFHAERASCF